MLQRLFIPLVMVLMAFGGCGTDTDIDEIDPAPNPSVEEQNPTGAEEDTVYQELSVTAELIEGFCAVVKVEESIDQLIDSKYPRYRIKNHGICISELPFNGKEIFERHSSDVRDASCSFIGNTMEVYGLAPEKRFFLRVWYMLENLVDETVVKICSDELAIDTPQESWFDKVSVYRYSIKDATIVAYLSPFIEAGWNGYDIQGSFEVELGESQFVATYAKLDPDYKQIPYEDSASEQIPLADDGVSFSMSLASLCPGQQVRIRPCVTVNGTKHYGEWQEFTQPKMQTEGYVRMSGYQWAACNAGASQPYELGTNYTRPGEAVGTATDCVVPHTVAWNTLISNISNKWVYGTLQGVAGWFVMFQTNTIFLPFTEDDEFGNKYGLYWTDTTYSPTPGFQVQVYFMCWNDPLTTRYQRCDLDSYYPVGTHALQVRLISAEQ